MCILRLLILPSIHLRAMEQASSCIEAILDRWLTASWGKPEYVIVK